jgi:hypothetical protein
MHFLHREFLILWSLLPGYRLSGGALWMCSQARSVTCGISGVLFEGVGSYRWIWFWTHHHKTSVKSDWQSMARYVGDWGHHVLFVNTGDIRCQSGSYQLDSCCSDQEILREDVSHHIHVRAGDHEANAECRQTSVISAGYAIASGTNYNAVVITKEPLCSSSNYFWKMIDGNIESAGSSSGSLLGCTWGYWSFRVKDPMFAQLSRVLVLVAPPIKPSLV